MNAVQEMTEHAVPGFIAVSCCLMIPKLLL